MKKIISYYDSINPFNGIFHQTRIASFPIKNFLSFFNSSRYHESLWFDVDQIIDELDHPLGWASDSIQGSYFEITFLNSFLEIHGYSLCTPSGDDEMLRNWDLHCIRNNLSFVIDTHTNDNTLCPEALPGQICGYADKKHFPINKAYVCDKIKLEITGRNNIGKYHLSVLGFELFGVLYIGECITCKLLAAYTKNFLFTFLISLIIS